MPNESCWRNSAKEAGPSGHAPDRFCPASTYFVELAWLAGGSSKLSNVTRSSFVAPGLIRQVIHIVNDRRASPGTRYLTARWQVRGPGGYPGTSCLVVYQELRAPDPRSKVTPFYGHTPPTLVDLLGVS